MDERLLARLLFGVGMLMVSIMLLFDFHWSDSGALARIGFAFAYAAALVGLTLDVKHRREDKSPERGPGSRAV